MYLHYGLFAEESSKMTTTANEPARPISPTSRTVPEIAADAPVLVPVAATDDESLVGHLLQWHAYARRRGLDLDLVILDERPGNDADRLKADLGAGPAGPLLGKPGGVFVLDATNARAGRTHNVRVTLGHEER
jgi:hypothetical protein